MASCLVELQSQEKVVQQLNELFGNVLNLDVIKKVAVTCEYDVFKSSNRLLEITSQSESKSVIEMNNLGKVKAKDLASQDTVQFPLTKFSSESLLSVKKSKKALDIERAVKYILKGYKVLIILRGLPGSGKSYLSKKILESTIGVDNNYKMHVLSTDDFFMRNPEGVYKYDPALISDAHNWNQQKAFEAMRRGFSPVIIDNTNTQMWEMKPYAMMGTDFGYIIEILEPDSHWCFNDKELTKRNKHGVPKSKIVDMNSRYDKNITPQKLLSAYNLSYGFQKPPQLRLYPPLSINVSNSSTNVYSDSDSDHRDRQNFATSFNSVSVQSKKLKTPFEIVDLMEFNDEDEYGTSRTNVRVEPLNEPKTKVLVDEILMVSNDSTNSGGLLQPRNDFSNVITIDSDDEEHNPVPAKPEKQKHPFSNIEAAWGINENYFRSWDIVSSVEDSDNLISFPSNFRPDEKIDTSETGCNTEEKYFRMITDESVGLEEVTIINSVNRDINRSTPKREMPIPKKLKIDKSCMTEDVYDDFDNHMEELKSLFPSIPLTHLTYWYNKCKGDLEWTIEFLLEAEESDIYIDESMISVEESDVKISSESSSPSREDNGKTVVENDNQKVSKNKKFVKNKFKDIKEEIEKKFDINPNKYSKHLLRIKKFKFNNGNRSADDAQVASTSEEGKPRSNSLDESNSKINDVIVIDSDMEFEEEETDVSEKSDEETEKTVELNLGGHFVAQLEQQFGDPNIDYPKGFQPVVQVPVALARQLYTFYVESVFQQMETQKQIMETLTKEDEEFARKLQVKEQEEASGACAKPMSFKEIMKEQETLNQMQKESEKWKLFTPDNLAAKLTRQKLLNSFPTVDPDTLIEILHANDNKYEETVKSLLDSLGTEHVNGNVEIIKEPPIADGVLEEMKDAQKNCIYEEYTEVRQGSFYREEATKFLKKRADLYQKAQQYSQRGMHEVAQFYSSLASQQTTYLERANSLAATAFLDEHSKRLEDFNTLDLHFLFVKEALPSLDMFLDRNINLIRHSTEKHNEYLHIITGRGKNSENGIAKLKPAVINHLKKRQIRYNILNPGLLKIKITKQTPLSVEI